MKQRWVFQGRMNSDQVHNGVDCYVWFWHPIVGVHPEAEHWHHFVHWVPVAEYQAKWSR